MTKQKILIVDDIEANLISLERVLADLNVTVVRASGGNDALIAILNHDFALAIIDVQMPGMDGYELAEYIRSEKKTESLPVIFLSAVYSDEYHVFKGYESGAVDFMTKPFNPYYLVRKIEIFLEPARQKELLRENLEIEHSKNYLESVYGSPTYYPTLFFAFYDNSYSGFFGGSKTVDTYDETGTYNISKDRFAFLGAASKKSVISLSGYLTK